MAAVGLSVSLVVLAVDIAANAKLMLSWFDLSVYYHGGLVARHHPGLLYSPPFHLGSSFTYTPFAALVFAAASLLPIVAVHWLMTLASLAALPFTVSVTFGALGWRGQKRCGATLALTALLLWSWPTLRALKLGQVELLLLALVVWDLCQSDDRRWKGAGVGLAAGIKLVPLIFIPYLILCGKVRAAATATATFAVTVIVGAGVLPQASAKWWLTGYFLHAGNVADAQSAANQSLRGLMARTVGSVAASTPLWLVTATVLAAAGLGTAAVLHRRGRPAAGWLVCALTGLLVSPISWDHHWVWIAPGLVVLTDLAARAGGKARWAYAAVLTSLAVIFAARPAHWPRQAAFSPQHVLATILGPLPSDTNQIRGTQIIHANLYVLSGLAMLAFAIAAAAHHLDGISIRVRSVDPAADAAQHDPTELTATVV